MDTQYHGNKRQNNDLQNITKKTKDPATRIPLINGGELCGNRIAILVTNPVDALRSPPWLAEYLCRKWPRICSVFRNYNSFLSSVMPYHRICDKSIMTGVNSGARTAYPSRDTECIPGSLWGSCFSILVVCIVFCKSFFVFFVLVLLSIMSSAFLRLLITY
jgi:hypothetical protein